MTPEQWARTQTVFGAALAFDRVDRDAFLDDACGDDVEVRAEVASLLAAHDRSADFIERPAFEVAAELLVPDPPASLEGRVIGPYIIRQEIGRGGMGMVYLADDTRLSRRVALKALAPRIGRDDDRWERLRLEARAAAALSHAGVATVYACEEIENELYLAMEYVPGRTLRSVIESGGAMLVESIDVAVQLARALAAAHSHGLVHRDLKPENVMKTSAGVVKILDFGVARLDDAAPTRSTSNGDGVGTPGYMAPEQIRGEAVDFRADLFSLGVLVYELASGSNPFEAGTQAATLARTLELDLEPLSAVCASSTPTLDRIVATCLQKDPAARYASTQQLVTNLERVQSELAGPADRLRSSAARWWEVHQAAVSIVYISMMYPAWRVRAWLPPFWGTLFLLVSLACAAAGTSRRLHLWFTARFYPTELGVERARARTWTRSCDVGLATSFVLAAFSIAGAHPEFAMLLLAVSVATATASFIIEPTTTRAAFGASSL